MVYRDVDTMVYRDVDVDTMLIPPNHVVSFFTIRYYTLYIKLVEFKFSPGCHKQPYSALFGKNKFEYS